MIKKRHYHQALLLLLFCWSIFALSCASSTSGTDSQGAVIDWTRSDVDGTLKLLLPFSAGETHTVTQGYNGAITHNTEWNIYGIDFDLAEEEAIVSVADGRVIAVKEDSTQGGALEEQYLDDTNFVTVDYGKGLMGAYFHFCTDCVEVETGDLVEQGDVIGYAGNTGYSDFPHLHFQMNTWSGGRSVSYGFYDVPDDGGLVVEGNAYTSLNDGSAEATYEESHIPVDAFYAEHGITLNSELSWLPLAGELLGASGTVDNSKPWVAFFILETNGTWITGVSTEMTDGTFSLNLTIPSDLNGNYLMGLATADTDDYTTNWAPYVLVQGN